MATGYSNQVAGLGRLGNLQAFIDTLPGPLPDLGAGISPSPGKIALYIWLFKPWKFPEPRSVFRFEHHCKETQDRFTLTPGIREDKGLPLLLWQT